MLYALELMRWRLALLRAQSGGRFEQQPIINAPPTFAGDFSCRR